MNLISKEYLKLIGIKWYTIWITWFLRSLTLNTIISVAISAAGFIQFPGGNRIKLAQVVDTCIIIWKLLCTSFKKLKLSKDSTIFIGNVTTGNNTIVYANIQYFASTDFGVVFMTFFVYSLQVSMFTILISQIFSTRTYISRSLFSNWQLLKFFLFPE